MCLISRGTMWTENFNSFTASQVRGDLLQYILNYIIIVAVVVVVAVAIRATMADSLQRMSF